MENFRKRNKKEKRNKKKQKKKQEIIPVSNSLKFKKLFKGVNSV